MPINIISGNLNTYGDQGQFEADRSTWGFTNPADVSVSRDLSFKTAGIYGAAITATNQITPSFPVTVPVIQGRLSAVAGKNYVLKAKIAVPTSNPIATDGALISIQHQAPVGFSQQIQIQQDVASVKSSGSPFVSYDLETRIQVTTTQTIIFPIVLALDSPDEVETFGVMYVDQFEIYEYSESGGPSLCTLQIDLNNTVTVNESAVAAADGSITVVITGGTAPIEYSKDNGVTWQSSNQFTGLTEGIYQLKVRDVNSCEDAESVAVNSDAVTHDFTMDITDESQLGLNDGRIEITVTGSTGPYTYSKDAGTTYQAENIFTALAPWNYTIVVKDNSGKTVAKNATIEAGLVAYSKIYLSKNHIPFSYTKNAAALDDWKIQVEVKVQESGTFQTVMTVEQQHDLTGKASFNFRPAFRGSLESLPPATNTTTLQQLSDRIKVCRADRSDLDGERTVQAGPIQGSPFLVLLGGIDKRRFPDIDFFSYLTTYKKFLTWTPASKVVDSQQEDYLCYLTQDPAILQLNLVIQLTYTDGTSETKTSETLDNITAGSLYQIPAGTSNLATLQKDPLKIIKSYQVWLTDQSANVLTEVKTFQVIQYRHPNTRHFLFQNSLGQFDVIRMTGFAEQSAEIEKTEIRKYLASDYSSEAGEFQMTRSMKRNKWNISTGFYTGPDAEKYGEYLQEFAISPLVYDITDGQRIPVMIRAGSFRVKEDQDSRYFIRFEMMSAFMDGVFTPKNIFS